MAQDEKMDMQQPEEEYIADLVGLEDEDGVTHVFELLDVCEVGDEEYVALVPYSEDPEEQEEMDEELYIMRRSQNGEEVYYDIIEDDEELESVMQVFLTRLEDEYDIDMDAED